MTQPINLVQGGKGFLIYFPIFIKDNFDGFILAVFNSEKWLNYVFNIKETEQLKRNVSASVLIDNENIYQKSNWGKNSYANWTAESETTILERNIRVKIHPTKYFFNDNSDFTPEIVLAYGITLSIIISIIFYLLQKTKIATTLAKNASQAKSNFVQSMSHELRTPLNAIIGFSELLSASETDQHKKENISHIYNAGKHLLHLINEVLDLATIESGKISLNIDDYHLNDLIDDSLPIIIPSAKRSEIQILNKISPDADHIIQVDQTRFKQVLLNVLSNAVKYNKVKGTITIDSKKTDNNKLSISISDTGNGLTPEYLAHIFEPFERFDRGHTHIEGTGLGLAISKDLIELMEGEMGVKSSPDKGSCFWFTIPLSKL